MIASLQQGLVAAQGDGLLDLLVEHLAGQDVSVGIAALAVEGTKVAHGRADVGVVDVAIDVEGAVRLRMQPARDGVGGPAQGVQVLAVEQGTAFVVGESLALDGLVEDGGDAIHESFSGGALSGKRLAFRGATFQLFPQSSGDLGSWQGSDQQARLFFVIAVSPFQSQPHRLENFGVVGPAWKEVPVQVGDLVAEQLVVELAGLENDLDGLGDDAHFVKEAVALGRR